MSRYQSKLIKLLPPFYGVIHHHCGKKCDITWYTIVTPGTKFIIHLSWSIPADIRVYFSSLTRNFLAHREWDWGNGPRGNRNLIAHHHWCGSQMAKEAVNGTDAVNTPVTYNSRSSGVNSWECSQVVLPPERPANTRFERGPRRF